MVIDKDVIMQKVQRFGGAMFTPVIMFGVFGIFVGISILCNNPMILGSIAEDGTAWHSRCLDSVQSNGTAVLHWFADWSC